MLTYPGPQSYHLGASPCIEPTAEVHRPTLIKDYRSVRALAQPRH
jgi:hypothetical protein